MLLGYLLISAVCSTVAFALFEVCTIFQLHDLMALDVSIKQEIGAEKLIKRGYFVLAVSILINFLSVLYFLALAWHTGSGVGTSSRWIPAAALELALLRAPCLRLHRGALPGRHLRRAAQVRQRGDPRDPARAGAASVGALALQKEAQIEQMMRDGVPLGAVAAALASPRRRSASRCWKRRRAADSLPWMRRGSMSSGRGMISRSSTASMDYAEALRTREAEDREEPAALASPLSQVVPVAPLATANGARS